MKSIFLIAILSSLSINAADAVKPPTPPPDVEQEIEQQKQSEQKRARAAKAASKSEETKKKSAPKKELSEEEKIDEKLTELGLTRIRGEGFAYKDVQMKAMSIPGFVEVIGSMANFTKDYQFATFGVDLLDAEGKLLSTDKCLISNFKAGEVKSFKAMIKVDSSKVKSYRLFFEGGL